MEGPRWTRRRAPKEATLPKLTDTQLVILSAAARRPDRAALPLPKSLKLQGGALSGVLNGLLKKGLVAERLARADGLAWR